LTGWVVDTCLLLDVLEDDPAFGCASAALLDAMAPEGLVLCPVSYAALAPAFEGNEGLQKEFLDGVGVDGSQEWTWSDTLRSHAAWHEHIRRRRVRQLRKRPLADILIGAFAQRHAGLLTRNPEDFTKTFPSLPLRVPGNPAAVPEDQPEEPAP
jgi:predicted nucleic acid-binding protein